MSYLILILGMKLKIELKMKIKEYTDGQYTAQLPQTPYKDEIIEHVMLYGYDNLFKAASVKELLDFNYPSKHKVLLIPCLIGQRSDRRFSANESFDLKVICNFIKSMNWDSVQIFDPHSDVSSALINNSVALPPFSLILKILNEKNYHAIITPDAGAYKKYSKWCEKENISLIAANKYRDESGVPIIQVGGNIEGKNLLIVDDLADGGRTFKFLARKLKEQGESKVDIYVSLGMFHFGVDELLEHIDKIYTTNSYSQQKQELKNNKNVHIFELWRN